MDSFYLDYINCMGRYVVVLRTLPAVHGSSSSSSVFKTKYNDCFCKCLITLWCTLVICFFFSFFQYCGIFPSKKGKWTRLRNKRFYTTWAVFPIDVSGVGVIVVTFPPKNIVPLFHRNAWCSQAVRACLKIHAFPLFQSKALFHQLSLKENGLQSRATQRETKDGKS